MKADYLVDLAGSRLGDPARRDVLDVGGGVGNQHDPLAGRLGSFKGVEVSRDSIERARAPSRARLRGP